MTFSWQSIWQHTKLNICSALSLWYWSFVSRPARISVLMWGGPSKNSTKTRCYKCGTLKSGMLRWHKNHSRLNTLEKNTRMRMRVACSADIKVFWNWLLLIKITKKKTPKKKTETALEKKQVWLCCWYFGIGFCSPPISNLSNMQTLLSHAVRELGLTRRNHKILKMTHSYLARWGNRKGGSTW